MLILLALHCAAPEYESELADAKGEMIRDAKRIADELKDAPTAAAILGELQLFLVHDQLPTNPHVLKARDAFVARRAVARYKLLEATPESEQGALRAKWAKEDNHPATKRKTFHTDIGYRWQHDSGTRWIEFSDKGAKTYEFRESGRTAEYIDIYEPIRKVTVRIYGTTSYLSTSPKIWSELHGGRWME